MTNPLLQKSPLPNVSDWDWQRFVRLYSRGRELGEISPCMHLGLFNTGFLRLKELGYTENVRQVVHGGKRVWFGTFKPPLTMRVFLSSPALQYRVFVEDMTDRLALVRPFIGRTVEGVGATASGLLAVAKRAGGKGFLKWIEDPAERARFENTTNAFRIANGIF